MANGYASNIPIENPAPEPELLPGTICIICKRRNPAQGEDMCGVCAKALAS